MDVFCIPYGFHGIYTAPNATDSSLDIAYLPIETADVGATDLYPIAIEPADELFASLPIATVSPPLDVELEPIATLLYEAVAAEPIATAPLLAVTPSPIAT